MPPSPPVSRGTAASHGDDARAVERLGQLLLKKAAECERRELDGLVVGQGRKAVARPIRKIEAELLDLLKRHPDDLRISGELNSLYTGWCIDPERPSSAAAELIAGAADPAGLAMRLAGGGNTPAATQLLLVALAHRPDTAALWLQAAQGVNRLDWQIALTAQGLRSLLAARGNPPDAQLSRLAAAVAEEELRLEISGGLLERAARQLALLPGDVRAVIESGATGAVEGLSGRINLQGTLKDVRLDLALLHLAQGDASGAAPLVAGGKPAPPLPPGPNETRDEQEARDAALSEATWYRLLEVWLEPSPEDPFELLSSILRRESCGRHRGLAVVARREGYPAMAAFLEQPIADYLKSELSRTVLDQPGAPPVAPLPADTDIKMLHEEMVRLAAQLEESARRSRKEAREALGADSVSDLDQVPAQAVPGGSAASRALTALAKHVLLREGTAGERLDGGHALDLFVLDHAGHRAYAIWSTPLWGGTVLLEEVDGSWRAEEINSWIS